MQVRVCLETTQSIHRLSVSIFACIQLSMGPRELTVGSHHVKVYDLKITAD
jgi:hypothetical protein